jgi:lysozyme family protein
MGIFKKLFGKKPSSGSTSSSVNIPPFSEIVKTIKIDDNRLMEVKTVCAKFETSKARYKVVAEACNFPIDLLFALHYRESSLNFLGVLHNGERILGTGQKTKLVPAGRGPFKTWEEAAIDAINMKKGIFPEVWNFETKLIFAERFNGLGYRKTREYSPYVFAGTNFHDETGKYVRDGKFDASAPEKQLGVASLILGLNLNASLV